MRRDVVAFDQRGVDTSSGRETRCLATLADRAGELAAAAKGRGKGAPLPPEVTRACLDELAASGADISKINTEQNARDVQAVMRALGYPVYAYGLSYGTKLGLEIMRTAPEGLRSVVLDSWRPPMCRPTTLLRCPSPSPSRPSSTSAPPMPGCAAAYPNLKARFWALYSKLAKAPVEGPAGKVDGEALVSLADRRNDYKNQAQGLTGYVPKLVAELEQGVTTTYDAVMQGKLPSTRPRRPPWRG